MPSKKSKSVVPMEEDSSTERVPPISHNAQQSIVVTKLKSLYSDRLLPIEQQYFFHKFFFPEILPSELEAKPTVLLIGQYSTGKTSFIRSSSVILLISRYVTHFRYVINRHLIQQDYPEIHIGPEPTTDRFVAIVHGDEEKIIKGNALTGVSDLPFAGLSTFGSGFLNKFAAAVVPAPLLKNLNIIDTPGVLSGEKQRTSRGYDFAKVSRWFAERADLILLMFDPSKLDISDEFRSVIEELQPHEDKVHCVLNKADSLDTESLMRVYGALLWSMGKVFRGAEVSRVYVGSFHDLPIAREEHVNLFKKDKEVLLNRLSELPKSCAMRKVNEMVKRIRLCIVNVCVLGYLRSQMPMLWGKESTQNYLIDNLDTVFSTVRRNYQLAEGDFPKLDEFKTKLRLADFTKFPRISKDVLNTLQDLLTIDIPQIISHVAGVVNDGPVAGTHGDGFVVKQPSLFKFQESGENKKAIIIAIISALVLLVALLIASILDNHSTADTAYRMFSNQAIEIADVILDKVQASSKVIKI